MKSPAFWSFQNNSPLEKVLAPLSCVYGYLSAKRANRPPRWKAPVPVICIGNLTLGGAGKTPSVLMLAGLLQGMGHHPFFLSRGYGGSITEPTLIEGHRASEVGDEPLLLSQKAPTVVSTDRVAGAKLCVEKGADVILMDDGFQNPDLHKDLSLIVIDGGFGHGNGRVFPAGPLRETLKSGLARCDGILFIGEDQTGILEQLKGYRQQQASIKADQSAFERNDRLIAFAGIARPEKFYKTLETLGANICERCSFADHHAFTPAELEKLKVLAEKHQARLITTHKDWVRLPEDVQKQVLYQKIELVLEGQNVIHPMLQTLWP